MAATMRLGMALVALDWVEGAIEAGAQAMAIRMKSEVSEE
jgi:hypothetical protein